MSKLTVTSDVNYDDDVDRMSVFPSYEDSIRGMDVENFIFSLRFEESLVLLFKSLSFNQMEICSILGYNNTGSIHQILTRIRNKKAIKEEF